VQPISAAPPSAAAGPLRAGWKWLLALGVLQTLIGLVALGAPVLVTAVAAVFFGWLLLFSGVLQIAHSFRCVGWGGLLFHLLGGLLAAAAGAWIAFFPLRGALGLTLVLASWLVVAGILRVALGLRVRPAEGWIGFLVAGLLTLALGVVLWSRPGAAVWLVGVVIGFHLLLEGLTLAVLGWRLGRS
jgi:uncharacterized membrane protein HdeD (DUF308 family)